MSGRSDAGRRLERALIAAAAADGQAIGIAAAHWVPWASASFTGARHELVIEAGMQPRLLAWIADLPEAELTVRGHLVADLAIEALEVTGGRLRAEISALTVEEC